MSTKPKWQCIVKTCENKRFCRGNCIACYYETRRQIKKGETTDAELVQKKLILPVNRTGRPSKNKMRTMIGGKK